MLQLQTQQVSSHCCNVVPGLNSSVKVKKEGILSFFEVDVNEKKAHCLSGNGWLGVLIAGLIPRYFENEKQIFLRVCASCKEVIGCTEYTQKNNEKLVFDCVGCSKNGSCHRNSIISGYIPKSHGYCNLCFSKIQKSKTKSLATMALKK